MSPPLGNSRFEGLEGACLVLTVKKEAAMLQVLCSLLASTAVCLAVGLLVQIPLGPREFCVGLLHEVCDSVLFLRLSDCGFSE